VRKVVFNKPPRRVLVISTPGYGDVLLATPLIRSIKKRWPEVRIDVITHRGREAMLIGNPDVDRCIPIPKRTGPLRLLWFLARTCGRYRIALAPTGGDRAVFIARCSAARAFTSLNPKRPAVWWHRIVCSGWAARNRALHTVGEILQLADMIDVDRVYDVVAPYTPDAAERVDAVLPFDWRQEPFAVLHVTTNARRKRWTVEGWATVARHFEARGWRCVLTGGPRDEAAYIEQIRHALGPTAIDTRGQLEMADIRAMLEASRIHVGVDTSTTHLAAAVGIPTVAIFGPGSPLQWAPWPKGYASAEPPFSNDSGVSRVGNVSVVRGDCPCGQHYKSGCGTTMPGRARCLEELSSATVLGAIEQLLGSVDDARVG